MTRGGESLMGYILPIQQYQYNDYQKRVVKDKQNTQHIDKPFKVILEKQHQDTSGEHDRLNKTKYPHTTPTQTDNKLFESLTGKGGHFSESI